jgi:hypothetical protein
MKICIAVIFFCAGSLLAQDGAEKATVALSDPSRPARIRAHLLSGSIIVRGANVKDVLVGTGQGGLDTVEEDNVVDIKTPPWRKPGDLVITVPHRSSLELKCVSNGNISVEQVDGEIDADDLNGKIMLKNVSGSVVAHSLNGSIVVTLDRVDPSKPMSFSTLNGDIDVTLPENVRANVRMKTDNGGIHSDFELKLDSSSQESGRQRALHGTINGGGPEFQFTSFNGQIYLHRKK